MSIEQSPLMRCPVCREPVQSTERALWVHLGTHSTAELLRYLWRKRKESK
jgi:hypothetical protein